MRTHISWLLIVGIFLFVGCGRKPGVATRTVNSFWTIHDEKAWPFKLFFKSWRRPKTEHVRTGELVVFPSHYREVLRSFKSKATEEERLRMKAELLRQFLRSEGDTPSPTTPRLFMCTHP